MAQLLIEVLQRCRKGEQSAFEEIVRRFQNKALDLAGALIGDKHLAEDAVQSAFLTAFCRLSQLRQAEAFPGWLRQIVRTEALKVIRKNDKSREEISEQNDNQLSPIEKMQREELGQIIRRTLSELSEINRQTAELFYLDEQSCAEIANTLNIPAGTVKRRLYDARQKLRDALEGYFEGPGRKRRSKRKKKEIPLFVKEKRGLIMAIKQTKQLEGLMQEAFDRKASYLYMIPNEPPVFRIKDRIERGQSEALTVEQVKDIATAAFGENDLKDIGCETGQLTTLCTLSGVVEGRMSVTRVSGDYVLSVRMLPAKLPDAEQLKIPEAILKAAMLPKGLVIFTGPTGSGKTTSLFSVLDYINAKKACAISTIEHSTGYHLVGKQALIQQREVGVDAPDMMTGISISVMQGADVLMIGELRNPEEIEMCIMISQNLLVLTQLHADLPQDAIQRMIDNLPEDNTGATPRRILAEKLRGVCAQRLLPRADGKGLTAAYGVLIPDEEMRKAIIEKRDILKRKTPLPKDCQTMAEDIKKLYQDGIISEETKNEALAEI